MPFSLFVQERVGRVCDCFLPCARSSSETGTADVRLERDRLLAHHRAQVLASNPRLASNTPHHTRSVSLDFLASSPQLRNCYGVDFPYLLNPFCLHTTLTQRVRRSGTCATRELNITACTLSHRHRAPALSWCSWTTNRSVPTLRGAQHCPFWRCIDRGLTCLSQVRRTSVSETRKREVCAMVLRPDLELALLCRHARRSHNCRFRCGHALGNTNPQSVEQQPSVRSGGDGRAQEVGAGDGQHALVVAAVGAK